MNREIKFRAWDGKKMHYKVNILSNWGAIKEGYSATAWNDESKAGIPMQFTGLTDKNGKEIYEGDIVKCHYFYEALGENFGVFEAEKEIIGEIAFGEMGLWIECSTEEDSGYLLWINGLHEESFEVIGNIYENPELIK